MPQLKHIFRAAVSAVLALGWMVVLTSTLSAQEIDFESQIKPIFENHCLSCHGEKDPEVFRIDIKDETMDYISVGDGENSEFYDPHLISDDEDELMPPPGEENPLSQEQITLVKNWIDGGANWPENVKFQLPAVPGEMAKEEAEAPMANRVWEAVGPLHMAAVHLPIGLLLAAGLFALLSLRGNFVMSDCAYYCLWLGMFGAVAATAFGWSLAMHEPKYEWAGDFQSLANIPEGDNAASELFWHRTSALIATVAAFLLCLFAAGARNKDPDDGVMWKFGVILLACGIGYTGHQGGELTHGEHLYDNLWGIVDSVMDKDEAVVDPSAESVETGETSDGAGEDGSSLEIEGEAATGEVGRGRGWSRARLVATDPAAGENERRAGQALARHRCFSV